MSVMSGSMLAAVLTASLSASVLTVVAMRVVDGQQAAAPALPQDERAVPPTEPAASEGLANRLDGLTAALDAAKAERSQLAISLREMNQRVNTLSDQLEQSEATSQADLDSNAEPSPHSQDELASFQSEANPANPERSQRDQLIAAGVDQSIAVDIEARQNRYQLARLDLIDQAEREGWRDSDEFRERLDALDEERVDMREELGDETYDRFLYEQGRSNRVGIDSVIGGSAAFQAGIRAGDTIVSYADNRVFRLPELQAATRSGQRGEYVQVTILRDGELIAVDVPRGPLGVTLRRQRREPG